MKKKVTLLICVVTCLTLVACGKEEAPPETAEVESTEEEETVEIIMPETEEEETEEVSREDAALEKINKLKTAYFDLIESKDVIGVLCQYYSELLALPKDTTHYFEEIHTKDGGIMGKGYWYPMAGYYYYEATNHDNPFNFTDMFESFENSEDFCLTYYGSADLDYINKNIYLMDDSGNKIEPNNVLMLEAAWQLPYIVSFNDITLGECTETTEYNICGIKSAYIYPVYYDGKDVGSYAIFAENGDLLNICFPSDFDSGVLTWPDPEVTIYDMIPGLKEDEEKAAAESTTVEE